jgi:hypothetical protein
LTRSKNPKRFTPKRTPLPPRVRKAMTRPAPRKAAPMPRTGFRG